MIGVTNDGIAIFINTQPNRGSIDFFFDEHMRGSEDDGGIAVGSDKIAGAKIRASG